jgi:hypothetical protein
MKEERNEGPVNRLNEPPLQLCLLGPLGMALAMPPTAVAFVLVKRLYVEGVLGDDAGPDRGVFFRGRRAGGCTRPPRFGNRLSSSGIGAVSQARESRGILTEPGEVNPSSVG